MSARPATTGATPQPEWRQPMFACGSCIYCSGGQHRNGQGEDVQNPHAMCLGDGTYSCQDGHPDCAVSFADPQAGERLRALLASAIDGNSDDALRLLAEFPESAHINLERSAIQVEASCDPDLIVAHFAIDPAALSGLITSAAGAGGK